MITILAVSALLTLGPSKPAVDTVVQVSRGARLELETRQQSARIQISAWDRDEVSVESAAPITLRSTGPLVRVSAPASGQQRQTTYQIRVPAWMPVEVNANRGDVTITGTEADVLVETIGGSVRVTGGSGRVSARSVDGSVLIENTRGRVDAYTLNQGVRVVGVSGEVRAETVNGDIRLERVDSRDLVVSTSNGDIDFDGSVQSDGRYRLTTHNGRISMTIAEGTNATVSVATFNGRYNSTFPIAVTQMGPDRRFTFVLGSGSARIEASSFNGNIDFRRPGQPRPER